MKSFLNQIKHYFGYSNSEASGFLVLLLLLTCFILLPFLYKLLPNNKDNNLKNDEQKLLALQKELFSKIDKNSLDSKSNYQENDFHYDRYLAEKEGVSDAKLFIFDPNAIDKNGFVSLGMPEFIAERIVKYRIAGGKFKSKDDLKKIYGLLPSTYARLEPFIKIEANPNTISENTLINNIEKNSDIKPEFPKSSYSKKSVNFDFNTVDTTTLMTIKGVGSKLSQRIIKFRDNLGGFNSENQVKEVFGLDSLVVNELLKFGTINSPVRKININTFSELKHPYLKPYIAKVIIAYRNEHGNFKSIDDLSKIKILDANTILKIKPYLIF